MTNILELLKNEKVEWKKLGEVVDIFKGKQLNKTELLEEGEFPAYNGGKTYSGWTDKYNVDENTIIISQGGASAGYVNYVKCKFWANAHCYYVDKNNEVDNRYIYHVLKMNQDYFMQSQHGSGIPALKLDKLKNFEIPVPSLEIQEKIVKILDKFTSYVTELQSELQSRTNQYTYYRDKLLSEEYLTKMTKEMEEDRKVNTLRLEEVCEFKRGKRLVKSELQEDGEFPVYQNSIIPLGYYHEKNFERDNTFIISAGAAGEIVYSDREFWAADDVYVLKTKENITSKYLYYLLLSKQYIIKSRVRKASIPRLSKDDIEKILVDIPPLSLQNKIVKVLDKFQILLSDTKGLLPEEIEQRQKQYEYYREKLLTFDVECSRTNERTFIISNIYYDILQEAANIVEVDINNQVIIKMLGELGNFTNGSGMPKTIFDEKGDVGAIHYGHIYTKYNLFVYTPIIKVRKENSIKLKKVNYGDIVIAKTSENIDDIMKSVAYLGKEEVVVGGHAAVYRHKQNPKYLSYVFNGYNDLLKQKNRLARGVKVIEISSIDMEKIKIPIPPLHVQQHVVSILDKFDTLVNDIKEGLPKEIEQRQKQYEYWRECLLNFPR